MRPFTIMVICPWSLFDKNGEGIFCLHPGQLALRYVNTLHQYHPDKPALGK